MSLGPADLFSAHFLDVVSISFTLDKNFSLISHHPGSFHAKENAWQYRLLLGYVASIKKEAAKSGNTTESSSYKMQVVCKIPWWSAKHDEMRYIWCRVNAFTSSWCPRLYSADTSAHLTFGCFKMLVIFPDILKPSFSLCILVLSPGHFFSGRHGARLY